jgi:carboxyl-terminal processing protease
LRKALPNPNGTTVDKEKDKQQEIKAPPPPAATPAAPGAKPDAPVAIKLGDPAQDYQLARALDLLRGLSLYRPPAAR